jgi:hypothetical protein
MFGKAMFGIAQNLTHRFNLAGGVNRFRCLRSAST